MEKMKSKSKDILRGRLPQNLVVLREDNGQFRVTIPSHVAANMGWENKTILRVQQTPRGVLFERDPKGRTYEYFIEKRKKAKEIVKDMQE